MRVLSLPRAALLSALLGVAVLGATTDVARADTATFAFTGGEQTFRVPAGVTSVQIQAIGGRGGAGRVSLTAGGFGSRVTANLAVSPLQLLYVNVGANGANTTTGTGAPAAFNGGGAGGSSGSNFGGGGGAGGGASDVRLTPSIAGQPSLDSRVVVAAGGGGNGGGLTPSTPGGDGGDAGENGIPGTGAGGGAAGTAATGSAPGGPRAGASGVGGTGGSSALNVNGGGGGGGGGGWFGGGGAVNGSGGDSAGGGGGGGSSFLSTLTSGGAINSTTSTTPSVSITYTLPAAPGTPGAGTPGGGPTPGTGGGGGGSTDRIETYIDSRPRQTVRTSRRRTSVTFRFSSNVDGAKFRCKLDSRGTETCRSGKRYRVGHGSHTFSVRAVKGKRSDSTPATFKFRVVPRD